MTFEIFMGLIGIPVLILLTAVTCYFIQTKRDQKSITVEKEGGISQ